MGFISTWQYERRRRLFNKRGEWVLIKKGTFIKNLVSRFSEKDSSDCTTIFVVKWK